MRFCISEFMEDNDSCGNTSAENDKDSVFFSGSRISYHKNRQENKNKFQAAEYQLYHPLVNSFIRISAARLTCVNCGK